MIQDWVLAKLEPCRDSSRVILRDPARLLPEQDSAIHGFAKENGFTVIVASTNLVFRDLYEQARAEAPVPKLLLIDRSPRRRRDGGGWHQSPIPLYPDLIPDADTLSRVELRLRDLLISRTGDHGWPQKVDEPVYARIITRHLAGVLEAHRNLRATDAERFTDDDFAQIVAFAAMGVPDAAFKKLGYDTLWRIGLRGHAAIGDLESLAPEVVGRVRESLSKAPAPFRWLESHDADTVLRAFYTALIISQHTKDWKLLLANLDPALAPFKEIDSGTLKSAADDLVQLGENQANDDLARAEQALGREAVQLLMVDQLLVNTPDGFAGILQRERFSTFVRELAMVMALRDLLSGQPSATHHEQIQAKLFGQGEQAGDGEAAVVERRPSACWTNLAQAYQHATQFVRLRKDLASIVKTLGVRKTEQLDFKFFWEQWNSRRLNRCEYYLSTLDRLIGTAAMLPRDETELPSVFSNAVADIRQRVLLLVADLHKQLDEVNRRFQDVVAKLYPSWIGGKTDAYLTCQFIPRVLKSHWDPQTERAVVLVFDGMRYDIFDELLRPMLADRLELVEEFQGCALLPSETEVSRWAIAAGQPPADWWSDCGRGEDYHLGKALVREFGLGSKVERVNPEGAGVGETVRYRAGKLDYIIFEFCDKELHKIGVKTLPDNRVVPSRPMALLYRQLLKDLIDNEVMAVIRRLEPGTKVFITADHGFGRIHRERIPIDIAWLNVPHDCLYLNAWLRDSLAALKPPTKVRDNVIEFSVSSLRMPSDENAYDPQMQQSIPKKYASIVFPRTGYALSRPKFSFDPPAYSHGGISVQELLIPMVVMRVKQVDEGPLAIGQIEGATEYVEGADVVFNLSISRTGKPLVDDLRLDIEASVGTLVDAEPRDLPKQVQFLSGGALALSLPYRFEQQDATAEERRAGMAQRMLSVAVTYRDAGRVIRRSRTLKFSVKLNADQVVRRVGNLGSILGLMPRGMK